MEVSSRIIGKLLVAAGAVPESEIDAALEEQRRTRERLGEVLMRRGLPAERVALALSEQLRFPYAQPPLRPTDAALKLVERTLAVRLRVLPLDASDRDLRVAMADPLDVAAIDALQFRSGRRVLPLVSTTAAIDEALMHAYGAEAVDVLVARLPVAIAAQDREPESAEVLALRRASDAPPVVALVDLLLARAAALGASDLHLEPADGRMAVRARVDGVLREVLALPARNAPAVVSRIKIMADLDISIKRRPQDGRAAVRVHGREIGMRVSTLPARGGEKVVLRFLDGGAALRSLEQLGIDGPACAALDALLSRRHGAILVTGPTGSGKSTTLYAMLARLDRDRSNVVTLEDPIEYRLPGLTQVQVHPRAGLSFAVALRAVLRQDPDVIMVGEMRDRETVEVGLAAALTGHLVLSTLHTNDAAGAVARLLEMRAPPFLVAGGLAAVVAQRLVRTRCAACNGAGCETCAQTGLRGRTAVLELLVVDDTIRRLIHRRASAARLRAAAHTAGMRTLAHDAQRQLTTGAIDPADAAPLLASAVTGPACEACGGLRRRRDRYCAQCGAGLVQRCVCGAITRVGAVWCVRCGSKILEPETSPR